MDGRKIIKITSRGNYPKYAHAAYSNDGNAVMYFLLGRIRTAAPIDPKDVKHVMAVAKARAIAAGMKDVHATAIDYKPKSKPKSGIDKPAKESAAKTADSGKTATVWVLCEAFTLVGDRTTVGDSLAPWAGVYPDRRTCMGALEQAVRTRVEENLEGSDPEPDEIDNVVDEVLSHAVDYGHQIRRYTYSCEDREVVWRVYPAIFNFPAEEAPRP